MTGLTGQTIGNYRILEKLGSGGMAEVYRAYHANLDRYVAIKFIRRELAEKETFQARFEREARTAARLRHENIVLIHDSGREGGLFYLVMEFIEGVTLKRTLLDFQGQGKRMPYNQVVTVLSQVATALSYAHEQQVVHRDVKPDNILMSADGRAMLTDFGIARMVDDDQSLTMTGTTMGTPAYMSPEQIKGERDKIGRGSDIYSLGIIIYEMLLGRVPFQADTPFAVMLKHVSDPIPLPTEVDPSINEDVQRVIFKGLSKDPQDRYQSAEEMVQELQDALGTLSNTNTTAAMPSLDSTARAAIVDTMPQTAVAPSITGPTEIMPLESEEFSPTEVMPTSEENAGGQGKGKWRRRILIGAGVLLGLLAVIITLGIIDDNQNGQRPKVLFSHDEQGVFIIDVSEDEETSSLSNQLTSAFGQSGTDYTFTSSNEGAWFVGSTERTEECDGWACLAVVQADLSNGEIVRLDGEVIHAYDGVAISDDGLTVIYEVHDEVRPRDLIWLEREEIGGPWEIIEMISEESPFDWNTFPKISPSGDAVIFMCGDEPYGGEGSALCHYSLLTRSMKLLVNPEIHQAITGSQTDAVHYPFYDREDDVLYTDNTTGFTWRIEEDIEDSQTTLSIVKASNDDAICILNNNLLVVPEWDEENMPIRFIDANSNEEVLVINTGFSGNELHSFSCGGG